MKATHRSIGGVKPFAILNIAATASGMSGQGIFPVSISITVQPRLQTSARVHPSWLCCWFRITSGAIQWGVPLSPLVTLSWPTSLLVPKSVSFTAPSRESSTLAP